MISVPDNAELPRLKECIIQEEFRTFIDKKVRCSPRLVLRSAHCDANIHSTMQLRTFWDLYGAGSHIKFQIESVQKHKRNNQENILILFRE